MPHFGMIPPEPKRLHSFDGCAPGFVRKVEAMLADLERDNWHPQVGETMRSAERVAFLHGFGREYDDGRGVVTNVADPSLGWHAYGLAVDIWNGAAKEPWAIGGTPFCDALVLAARAAGLMPAADWPSSLKKIAEGQAGDVDWPHVQFGGMRNTPSQTSRDLYERGDIEAVWRLVGADA